VAEEVAERIEQGIPPLALRFQPTAGVLTQVPLLLGSGQPRDQRWRMPLLGREVSVDAHASWSWEFGDGGHLDTTDPGGRYPHVGVSHVYRAAGEYRVACTTRWSASFTVDGLGPFPVPQPITQHAERAVDVGEGRALLTPGGMAQ
jgi:hypothetical protein